MMCDLLCLTSLTYGFEAHPGILFIAYICTLFLFIVESFSHCVDTLHFVYPFTDSQTFRISTLWP